MGGLPRASMLEQRPGRRPPSGGFGVGYGVRLAVHPRTSCCAFPRRVASTVPLGGLCQMCTSRPGRARTCGAIRGRNPSFLERSMIGQPIVSVSQLRARHFPTLTPLGQNHFVGSPRSPSHGRGYDVQVGVGSAAGPSSPQPEPPRIFGWVAWPFRCLIRHYCCTEHLRPGRVGCV